MTNARLVVVFASLAGTQAVVPLTAMGSLLKTAPVALKALSDMVARTSDADGKYWLDRNWVKGDLGAQ